MDRIEIGTTAGNVVWNGDWSGPDSAVQVIQARPVQPEGYPMGPTWQPDPESPQWQAMRAWSALYEAGLEPYEVQLPPLRQLPPGVVS